MIDELGGTNGNSEKLKKELKEKDELLQYMQLQLKKKEIETMKLSAQKEMLMHAFLQKDVGLDRALHVQSYQICDITQKFNHDHEKDP